MRSPVLAVLPLLAAACGSAPVSPVPVEPAVAEVVRVPFEVDADGWRTAAELVHPAANGPHGKGPFPVVLLLCGNGPHDMDVTLPGPGGTVKLFAQVSDTLAARGFAVVRYHKRFVRGPGKVDPRFWREQSTIRFTADADRVLQAALRMAPCDGQRLFLYGWSEGTAVAAQLAVERGDVDGLVLHGAVGLPWRDMVRFWIEGVGLPLAQGADGGAVTTEELTAALRGKAGMVAKLGASFLADPMQPGVPLRPSRLLDGDADGVLDVDREVLPHLDAMLDFAFSPQGNVYVYAPGRTVPTVSEQATKLPMPVLILQGEHDASTPVASGRALAAALRAAGNGDVTLWELAGLGHTLGPAASLVDDCGRAPAAATLLPIAGWLAAHAAR